MYITGENLTSDLLDANMGQERPAVFSGHSFGGLVIKQVCTLKHQAEQVVWIENLREVSSSQHFWKI